MIFLKKKHKQKHPTKKQKKTQIQKTKQTHSLMDYCKATTL